MYFSVGLCNLISLVGASLPYTPIVQVKSELMQHFLLLLHIKRIQLAKPQDGFYSDAGTGKNN